MAVFPRKAVLCGLLVLLLISIAVRYPLVEHERQQTDSYSMHYQAKSIMEGGRATWTFDSLSYVGYYPFSYPSGIPFLLAEFSILTGLSVELTILVSNMIFAVVFCLGVFLFARQFVTRPEFALLATYFSILGSRFIDTTYWDGSARGPFVVLMVLAIFASFRASDVGQRRLVGVAVMLGIGCLVVHHMAVLVVLFGLAYVMASLQSRFLLQRVRLHRKGTALAINSILVVSIFLFVFVWFDFFEDLAVMNLQRSSLFDINPPILSVILNMAASYANQIGFILIFAFLSLPSMIKGPRFSIESLYPVTLLLAFVPLLGDTLYVSMLLSPFVAFLGVAWFARAFSRRRKTLAVFAVLMMLMVASALMPIWSTNRWNSRQYLSEDTVEVDSSYFNDAAFLRVNNRGDFAAANVNAVTSLMAALSSARFMAAGIPSVVNGDISRADVIENLTSSRARFPMNLYSWFEYPQEQYVEYYKWGLMVRGVSYVAESGGFASSKEYFSSHSKMIVAIDNGWSSEYIDVYVIFQAKFPAEIRNAVWTSGTQPSPQEQSFPSYSYYASEMITLYIVELPL